MKAYKNNIKINILIFNVFICIGNNVFSINLVTIGKQFFQ